jgi:hypothetical protein
MGKQNKRAGSSLGDPVNTKSGPKTPVYPTYLNAPRTGRESSEKIDDAAYKRNLSRNIAVKDTIHTNRQAMDGSNYKVVSAKGSGNDETNKSSLGTVPTVLQPGRNKYLTEEDNSNSVKNWVAGGKKSKAKR